jgi:hypothetical protein
MSGRKNNLKQFNTINAASMTTSITSEITDIQFLDDIGIQFTWTGSPVGNFQILVSADYSQDYNGNVLNPGHWIPLTMTYWNGTAFVTSTSIPTSVGSPVYVDLALLSAPYIQAMYNFVSGSGTLTTTITAKML